MIALARSPAVADETVPALPGGLAPEDAWCRLADLAEATLGPGWRLFAAPRREAGAIVWEAEGEAAKPYFDLAAADRAALRAALGAAVAALRRAAERRDAETAALIAGALEVPGWEAVHLVDGRPVLAPWGLRPAGRPAGASPVALLDQGRPAHPAPPWPALATTAAALVLLALLALLLAPWWGRAMAPAVATACRANPAQFDALAALLEAEGRGHALAAELAGLQAEYGRRQSECPLAAAPPEPPPPPPAPPPRPAPAPPVRPADAQPCDVETRSGGRGITRTRHFLGDRPGRVTLDYDTLIEPDHIEVLYRGRQLATTYLPVSGRGRLTFDWQPTGTGPDAHVVEVVVTGFGLTTRWSYTIGCPR